MTTKLDKSALEQAAASLSYRTQAFVDGQFVGSVTGKTFVTENPATGQPLAQVAACDTEDVNRAVTAARRSFEAGAWSRIGPSERKGILLHLADLIEAHSQEFALLDALEAGKPIVDCMDIDVPETITCIRWHAEAADKLYDQIAPTAANQLGMIVREPIGVVGAVIPWNFPLLMAAWKLGPAVCPRAC